MRQGNRRLFPTCCQSGLCLLAMPMKPGTRFGSYEITGALGAGGMGEVYRARDMKLGREVALKVLPDLFAADPERLARFEREAQVLASLNHPNIAHIHGLEEDAAASSAGQVRPRSKALVLELVEGPTLADRIARGPLPLAEAVAIATQIADALDAAHEQNVIHRDLKPANIIKVRERRHGEGAGLRAGEGAGLPVSPRR